MKKKRKLLEVGDEIDVTFQKGDRGGVVAFIPRASFVVRGSRRSPKPGEWWYVKIAGQNPRKTVFFLDPVEKVEERSKREEWERTHTPEYLERQARHEKARAELIKGEEEARTLFRESVLAETEELLSRPTGWRDPLFKEINQDRNGAWWIKISKLFQDAPFWVDLGGAEAHPDFQKVVRMAKESGRKMLDASTLDHFYRQVEQVEEAKQKPLSELTWRRVEGGAIQIQDESGFGWLNEFFHPEPLPTSPDPDEGDDFLYDVEGAWEGVGRWAKYKAYRSKTGEAYLVRTESGGYGARTCSTPWDNI